MANWTADDPGRIDSGALGTTATTIQTTETSLTEARTVAVTAQGGISDAIWSGDAATAWVSSLSTPIGKIDAITPAMAAVRDAIATYTTTVDDIKTRATSYTEMIFQANISANQTYLDPMGGPTPEQQMQRDQVHQAAVADRQSAQRLLDALSEERQAADDALASALSSPGGDNWDRQQAALAAIGITSASDLTPSAVARGMAEMAAELGNGTFETDLAAQLQSLYALYGNDPSVMAQMNLALGGEDLISLISRIDDAGANGWMTPAAALLLAQSVRGGLSVGSQRWTDAVGQNFAQELYDGSASVHGTESWTSLAFLFGDEQDNPIGETTTVGLANIADEMERGLPGAHEGMYGPAQGVMGPGGFLSLAEAEQAGYDVNRLGDWTSRVFSTLGEYPEAAMDWLTSTEQDPYRDAPLYPDEPYESNELGANRLEYWFGRRDSGLDGFEGVLALWAGAESIPGGPADPAGADPDAYTRVATLSHDVIERLVGNPRDAEVGEYVPGNDAFDGNSISDLGAVKLVEALSYQFPGLIERPIAGEPIGFEGEDMPSTNPSSMFGIDGLDEFDYANLSKEALAKVFGVAGQNDAGAAALDTVVAHYQETLSATVQTGLSDPGEASKRIMALQGLLDGSTDGVALDAAADRDAAVESALGLVETGVGFLPIPGLDKLVGVTGDAVIDHLVSSGSGYVTGQLVGAAKDVGLSTWGAAEQQLLNQQGELEIPRERAAAVTLGLFLYDTLQPAGMPDPSTMDPDEQFAWASDPDNMDAFDELLSHRDIEELQGDYSNAYAAFNAHGQR